MKQFILALSLFLTSNGWSDDQEIKKFLDQMISEQKQEVEELQRIRDDIAKNKVPKFEDELLGIQKELTHDFDRFVGRLRGEKLPEVPKVEMKNEKTSYDIKVEIPGMDKEDVKVSLNDKDLTISGMRKSEDTVTKKGKTSTEFSYGEFKRVLHLDEKVDPKSLNVEFGKGIVTIHLDKTMKSKI